MDKACFRAHVTTHGGGGGGGGNRALLKHLQDPEMKNTFWNVVTSVGLTEGVKQTSKWQPKKFFIDKYGAEEAEEMMENGTLM
eukprot:4853947-Pyramimonas_sp.AAC.1